jgi:hypothetical protein
VVLALRLLVFTWPVSETAVPVVEVVVPVEPTDPPNGVPEKKMTRIFFAVLMSQLTLIEPLAPVLMTTYEPLPLFGFPGAWVVPQNIGVAVAVGVNVGVIVGVGVAVPVWVAVGVIVGVDVIVGVWVIVGVNVGVKVRVGV